MTYLRKWKFDFRPDPNSFSITLIVQAESLKQAQEKLRKLYPRATSLGIPFDYYGSQPADVT